MSNLKAVYQYLLQLTGEESYNDGDLDWPKDKAVKITDDEVDTVLVKLLLLGCTKSIIIDRGATRVYAPGSIDTVALILDPDRDSFTNMASGVYVYQLSASFLKEEGLI